MTRYLALVALIIAMLLVACNDDDGGSGSPTETPGASDGTAAPAVAFADACQPSEETQWPTAPPLIIDTSKQYVATITTAKGDIVAELYSDTPVTTNNFVFLACKGFYDGLTFHRVVPDFVIQGGDPTGSGSGGPGYAIPDEDDPGHLMEVGVISMAKAGPDTTGSQFFVTIGLGPDRDLSDLDAGFTVFGEVTEGQDVAEQIVQGDLINSVTIQEQDAS
jgi:peptidyl-prolyl cis-trans isomerase B (cyclophilin B)